MPEDTSPGPGGVGMTSQVRRPRVNSLGLLLPESWWTIDLRDDAARRRGVAEVVERQIGRSDQHAALRADTRKHLMATADDAARAGGRLLAISLMVADGVPLPATLTVYRLPGQDVTGHGMVELEANLRQEMTDPAETSSTAGTGASSASRLDLAEGPTGAVLRRVAHRPAPADLGGADVTMLVVHYWLDADDGHGLVHLVFSSPLTDAQDALLHLFDVIVGSLGPAEGEG